LTCHLRIKSAPFFEDLRFKSALLRCLRSVMVCLPGIITTIRRTKAILTLSRRRERVGVRVGTNHIPPHLCPLPYETVSQFLSVTLNSFQGLIRVWFY
jgi:hypothetical protein